MSEFEKKNKNNNTIKSKRYILKKKIKEIERIIVQIDSNTMDELDIKTGDVISIRGKKESVGIAWPSDPKDNGLGFVRVDSLISINTGTDINNTVEIQKVEPAIAKNLVLAPINSKLQVNPKVEIFIKKKLINYPVTIDDLIFFKIGINRIIKFKVIDLKPESICIITQKTKFTIKEKFENQKRSLQIKEAKLRDIGRNIIRIDVRTMKELFIEAGDVISIVGKRESVGIAWPSYPQDIGLDIIRIDSCIRMNTGTDINDTVEIQKVEPAIAKNLVLKPMSKTVKMNSKSEFLIKKELIDFPVTLNDIITLSPKPNQKIQLKVINLNPMSICIVKEETNIVFSKITTN
ncbi:MAG: hypothetical protein JXA99_09780 [Candidatus Lokiarchaeota archaeon]|nr:hypothetical protein [Candidatus Lokiarchaeota archaeon]